jgi:hypothetical protein
VTGQRCWAVLEVLAGVAVTEVAERYMRVWRTFRRSAGPSSAWPRRQRRAGQPPAPVSLPAHERVPWRPAVAGAASLGTPVGIGMLNPLLGEVIVITELVVALTVIATLSPWPWPRRGSAPSQRSCAARYSRGRSYPHPGPPADIAAAPSGVAVVPSPSPHSMAGRPSGRHRRAPAPRPGTRSGHHPAAQERCSAARSPAPSRRARRYQVAPVAAAASSGGLRAAGQHTGWESR